MPDLATPDPARPDISAPDPTTTAPTPPDSTTPGPTPPDSSEPADRPRLRHIGIAVVATAAEHEALMDRFTDVLCPDVSHDGPCAVPWAMSSVDGDSLSRRRRRDLLAAIEDTNPGSAASL